MNVVIINKEQRPMDFSLALPGESRITVSFDGPALPLHGVHVTSLPPHPDGFYAGANRNHGLMESYKVFGKSGHVLFLDGDRVPYGYSRNIILETLAKYKADALLLTCLMDPRSIAETSLLDGPVDTGCLVSEFFSCGFVLTDNAIEKVMEANDGYLFHPDFNGHWGEEDKYLGIQLHNLGMRTCFTNAIKLGGGPLGGIIGRVGYALSLQTRINLMIRNGYPLRQNDMHAHLEKDASGKIIKVYDGLQIPHPI